MKKLITFLVVIPAVSLLSLKLAAVITGTLTIPSFAQEFGPFVVVCVLGAGFSLVSYLLGLISGDLSWVDRMWSTVPVLYAWIYAYTSGYDLRVTVVALLITLWGARLTYNFARRGGYTTMEDYRWGVLRDRINRPVLWQFFSLLFISTYQNLLFVLFTLPAYALYLLRGGTPGVAFWAGGVAFILFLGYETLADQQQWEFQNAKEHAPAGERADEFAGDIRRGFRTSGLFRYSRHPNYFGELMVWWMIYQMGTTAAGSAVHWSGIGALLLTLLFIGSTWFTESISSGKYPEYADYRATTSAIVPLPPRTGMQEQTREAD